MVGQVFTIRVMFWLGKELDRQLRDYQCEIDIHLPNKAAKAGIKKVELYERKTDPPERHDLSAEHPADVERDIAALVQWIAAQNKVRNIVGHGGTTDWIKKHCSGCAVLVISVVRDR